MARHPLFDAGEISEREATTVAIAGIVTGGGVADLGSPSGVRRKT